ncbi:MAG: orotidine-5'-phosphate decarboxylase [Candidatus Auribacterota bacterium]|jgi:orotidine-5'-phosphate decarboxylase|nr:orotidine-5'-phosphate decarboxylase [Candidatus Auribacterota bacterium]
MNKGIPILALDLPDIEKARIMVEQLGDSMSWYKVGSVLFTKEGPGAIEMLKKANKKIFLDLKFHDIPNTVAGAIRQCVSMGIDMLTVHASGGFTMIAKAVEAAATEADLIGLPSPKIIVVTLLTSLDSADLQNDFDIKVTPEEITKKLVKVAQEAGAHGVVSSPNELFMIRKYFSHDLLAITPGVRPSWSKNSDQKRVMTPVEAVNAGADFLVIGRPILQADNPKQAAETIREEIREVTHG